MFAKIAVDLYSILSRHPHGATVSGGRLLAAHPGLTGDFIQLD
jgi:hypothetical protein